MSGTERIDIPSAQLSGLNESESAEHASVHVEPSSGESEPVCTNSVIREAAKDSGSISDWHVGKCFGESPRPILSMGKELGRLDNEVLTCDTFGVGIEMPICRTIQQSGDGLTAANAVAEQLPVHDGTRTSNCGNVEILGYGSSPTQLLVGEGGSCGAADDHRASSTCKNEAKPAEIFSPGNSKNLTNVVVEGNQAPSSDITVQAEKCISLMQAATGEYALGYESPTCEPSAEKSNGQESVKSEMSDPNVVLPNKVGSELFSEGLITRDNSVNLPCELNLQNGSIDPGVEFSSCVVPGLCGQRLNPNQKSGEQRDVFSDQSLPNQSLDEKIGTQTQNDSSVQENPVDDSSKSNDGGASVDYLLNKPVQSSNVVLSSIVSETTANCSRIEEALETLGQGNHGSAQSEQVEQKEKAASADLDNAKENQHTESNLNDGAQRSLVEEVEISHHGMSKSSCRVEQPAASDAKDFCNERRGPFSEEITEKLHVVVLATPATVSNEKVTIPATATNEKSRRGRRQGKTSAVSAEKKYALRSSVDNTRASHSSSQENGEASQPNTILENSKGSTGRRRGRKSKMEMNGKSHDEFARMRKHLRYLLHRIRYEQNLLDAYSSEGWRGQSIEKLRPEKELQRAKADIIRSKLKIRDLFQRLDSMSAEGKFPDSLFDSEGLIDSEDIFCAKCGSKELSTTNDIILCDGACDRGFHQYCLEPPLRTEEIPPGDEGWLCPACDCKVDCLDLLNDSQGAKLSIEDSWEKVFPEAAASMVGNEQDDIMGLPSDDSEDNDFNPDGTDDDVKDEGSESSSDESDSSDFSSASEDLGAITGNEQYLGLPSDDSEDDDYDPDAANVNEDVEHETSSSDYTSAAEDLGPAVENGGTSGNLESKLPLSEPDQDMGDSPSVSGRRHVERLDYKKLYDETYGNANSDSSDDEEWADVDSTRKGKRSTKKGGSVSSNADASSNDDASMLADNTGSVGAPKRRGRKKLNSCVANGSSAQQTERSQKIGSSSKSLKRPPYNRLGEAVTQRLYESFKENQYPDRRMKEKLANELGLTPEKVNKWFGNARWSFNHHRERIEASMAAAASHSSSTHNDSGNGTKNASAKLGSAVSENGIADSTKMDTKESGKKTSVSKRGRKRKETEDDQPILQSSNTEISIEGTKEAQHGEIQKRRKAGAQ